MLILFGAVDYAAEVMKPLINDYCTNLYGLLRAYFCQFHLDTLHPWKQIWKGPRKQYKKKQEELGLLAGDYSCLP